MISDCKAEKEDQLSSYRLFWGCGGWGGGGWCLNLEDPEGGGKFCLGNTYLTGGWFTCNCLSIWACFN